MKPLIIASVILLLCLSVPLFLGWIYSAPGYKGPVSDHFDGRRFYNPGGLDSPGFRELIKWMRNRERGIWIERNDIISGNPPPGRMTGDSIRVTFVNHSTFLIQTMGLNILTDPVWSERASPVGFAGPKRMRSAGIRIEDLPGIDIILLTHNHYDHLDIRTVRLLEAMFQPEIYCPLGVGQYLARQGIGKVVEMDWWDSLETGSGVSVLCTPAQHFSGRGMFDRNRTLWCGFALITDAGSIYYSGDTGFGDFFKEIASRISPIRLAFLPIGAYKPVWFMSSIHTSPGDAMQIHREIGSANTIGMHYGTFPLADDGMDEPMRDLERARSESGMTDDSFILLEEGKFRVFN